MVKCPVCGSEVFPIKNEEGYLICPKCGTALGREVEDFSLASIGVPRKGSPSELEEVEERRMQFALKTESQAIAEAAVFLRAALKRAGAPVSDIKALMKLYDRVRRRSAAVFGGRPLAVAANIFLAYLIQYKCTHTSVSCVARLLGLKYSYLNKLMRNWEVISKAVRNAIGRPPECSSVGQARRINNVEDCSRIVPVPA